MDLRFGWIVRRDMPAILEIERASFAFPWSEGEFLEALLERGCIGVAAKSRERVVGFLIYNPLSAALEIVNLAVATELRRQGIGRQLVEFLKEKLSPEGRCEIVACVG